MYVYMCTFAFRKNTFAGVIHWEGWYISLLYRTLSPKTVIPKCYMQVHIQEFWYLKLGHVLWYRFWICDQFYLRGFIFCLPNKRDTKTWYTSNILVYLVFTCIRNLCLVATTVYIPPVPNDIAIFLASGLLIRNTSTYLNLLVLNIVCF